MLVTFLLVVFCIYRLTRCILTIFLNGVSHSLCAVMNNLWFSGGSATITVSITTSSFFTSCTLSQVVLPQIRYDQCTTQSCYGSLSTQSCCHGMLLFKTTNILHLSITAVHIFLQLGNYTHCTLRIMVLYKGSTLSVH